MEQVVTYGAFGAAALATVGFVQLQPSLGSKGIVVGHAKACELPGDSVVLCGQRTQPVFQGFPLGPAAGLAQVAGGKGHQGIDD
jgi:hypothetical protein